MSFDRVRDCEEKADQALFQKSLQQSVTGAVSGAPQA